MPSISIAHAYENPPPDPAPLESTIESSAFGSCGL
jgi:hypothetical protein